MTGRLALKRHLFFETSHSPSLVEMVGYRAARGIVDFCYIANPYYPTPAMMRDLQRRLPLLIKSYPSSQPGLSQAHLGRVLGVDPGRLVIGNGASELIAYIEETLVSRIAIPVPTFSEYLEKLRHARDARLYRLPPGRDYRLDLEDYAGWVLKAGLRSCLVINPGNPTGELQPREAMLRFLRRMRGLDLVLVDESFIDFAGERIPSLLHDAGRFPNLVIVRSMSKHCGVPGLRLGYACTANERVLRHLRHVLPVWNINSVAEYFLSLLPDTNDDYHRARRRLMAEVARWADELARIPGFHVYPTAANFLLIRIENGMTAARLQRELLVKHRLYVRDCANKVGLDDRHIRAASQGREKDRLLVRALWTLAGGRKAP